MSFLRDIDLTSTRVLLVMLVLTVLVLLVCALLLPHTRARHRPDAAVDAARDRRTEAPAGLGGSRRQWHGQRVNDAVSRAFVRLLFLVLPVVMVLSTGALAFNQSLRLVTTSGSLIDLIAAQVAGSTAASGEATTSDSEYTAEQLATTFTSTDSGMLTTTWTGPTSGITLPVYVITPSGYSTEDGKTYAVVMMLHGWPGDPEGLLSTLEMSTALQSAIDSGIIPPTIIVAPSLNVDAAEHDCADITGRPAVYTWTAKEVPAMVRANFPNVSTTRDAWMIAGISAGAYCAAWTAMRTAETFGAAGVLSGYDTQVEGEMKNQGSDYQAANTLSTMLGSRTPDGLRIYALAAQDDPYNGAQAAWNMAAVVQSPDSVTTDTPETGGHSFTLWTARIPTLLAWWGSTGSVAEAVGSTSTADAAMNSSAYSQIVSTSASTISSSRSIFQVNGVGSMGLVGLVGLLAAAATLCRSPRWVAADEKVRAQTQGMGPGTCALRIPEWWLVVRKGLNGVPRHVRSTALFLARLLVLTLAAVLLAAVAGMVANTSGGFYTSWEDVWTTLSQAFK